MGGNVEARQAERTMTVTTATTNFCTAVTMEDPEIARVRAYSTLKTAAAPRTQQSEVL